MTNDENIEISHSTHFSCLEHSKQNKLLENSLEEIKNILKELREGREKMEKHDKEIAENKAEINKFKENLKKCIPVATLIIGFFLKDISGNALFTRVLMSLITGTDVQVP